MITGTLTKYCDNNNWATNTWLRPTELNYIALESDANQFYNPMQMKIMFDTTNEIIKLKYAPLKEASSRLAMFSYNPITYTLIFNNYAHGTVYSRKYTDEPKVGDTVVCYDPVKDLTKTSVIESITYSNIGTSNIKLSTSAVTDYIKEAKNALRFSLIPSEFVSNAITIGNDKSQYYIETNLTKFPYDISLRTNNVVGFDFCKDWGYGTL